MKRWVWFVIGGLVLALAAGGVLYGVLTHKEPGLMKVCWQSGQAVYNNPDCTTELKWKKDQLPLPYFINFEKDHKDYIDSVVKGADLWNKEIAPVFKRVDKESDAKVIITWGSIEVGKHCSAGSTSHQGTDGPTNAKIVLRNPSDIHAVYRFAAHEFGHVLGLAHDEAKRSIMYPVQPDVTDEMTFVLPSDYDKKLLRELYR
jgi:hypothetical protein